MALGSGVRAQTSAQDIAEIQQRLSERGFDPGPADGLMGPRTREAIRAFQSQQGLAASGQADEATVRALLGPERQPSLSGAEYLPAVPLTPEEQAPLAAEPAVPQSGDAADQPAAPATLETTQLVGSPGTQSIQDQPNALSEGAGSNLWWILVTGGMVVLVIYRMRRRKGGELGPAVKAGRSGRLFAARVQTGEPPGAKAPEAAPLFVEDQDIASVAQDITELAGGLEGEAVLLPGEPGDADEGPISTPESRAENELASPGARPAALESIFKKEGDRCWVSAGTAVKVQGHVIPGGMVYVGARLRPQRSYGSENCLINPSLKVARHYPDRGGANMPYYPSYDDLAQTSRLAYLQWLAQGRSDPKVDIGYVFLFFYGLERRLMLDQAADERNLLIGEVERLRSLYGWNRSFERYAHHLLEAAALLGDQRDRNLAEPNLAASGWEVPLSVKIAVGEYIAQKEPLPANWALAWYMHHPETRLRTSANRARADFVQLLGIRFAQRYPQGMTVAPPKSTLSHRYRAASGSFEVALDLGDPPLPDIGRLTKPVRQVGRIAEECMDELDRYSRFLGRHPEKTDSLEAQLLLPDVLLDARPPPAVTELRAWLSSLSDGPDMSVRLQGLLRQVNGADSDRITRKTLKDLADTLGRLGFGLAPDPHNGFRVPTAEEVVVVYPLPAPVSGAANMSEAYRTALLVITMASLVVHADDEVTEEEERFLLRHIAEASRLDAVERTRLAANLTWLLIVPPEWSALRARLGKLGVAERGELGRIAVAVAGADGHIDPSEIRILERLYKTIGLDPQSLFNDLHSLGTGPEPADEPVTIRPADPREPGHAIPAPPTPPRDSSSAIQLDPVKIREIMTHTRMASEILGSVFVDDEPEPEPEVMPEDPEEDGQDALAGLDAAHQHFVSELLSREHWPRDAFEKLARSCDLMANGAMEAINEWAFELFDEALIDDDEPLVVHRTLLQELTGEESVHV